MTKKQKKQAEGQKKEIIDNSGNKQLIDSGTLETEKSMDTFTVEDDLKEAEKINIVDIKDIPKGTPIEDIVKKKNDSDKIQDVDLLESTKIPNEGDQDDQPIKDKGEALKGIDLSENINTIDFLDESVSFIKELRVKFDGIIKFVDVSAGAKGNTRNSLFNAKAWLGKLLEQYGTENPYKTKQPITNARQIPPTADVAEGLQKLLYDFGLKTDVEKIVFIRELVQKSINDIESHKIHDSLVSDMRLASIAKTQSYVHACEARFALGNELAILRDRY
jgi:hypothetical protein